VRVVGSLPQWHAGDSLHIGIMAQAAFIGGLISEPRALEPWQVACADAADIMAMVYTSPSHTTARPRWRVVGCRFSPSGAVLTSGSEEYLPRQTSFLLINHAD
jgi:hypothetical protein